MLLLRLEHGNLSQLLDLIEEQCQLVKTGNDCDPGLLEVVAEYFGGYPDQCHHPVEDLVFQRLKERAPAAVSDPNKLTDEPREIERLTENLSQAVSEAGSGRLTNLAEAMERFVTGYRLESKPTGGYTGSRELIDISDCDVAQAMRCAYFFVQGLEEEIDFRHEGSRLMPCSVPCVGWLFRQNRELRHGRCEYFSYDCHRYGIVWEVAVSNTNDTVLAKTIVLEQDAQEETESLDDLAALANDPETSRLTRTIVLGDETLNESRDISKLAEMAMGADEPVIDDDLDILGALDLGSQTKPK